MYFNRPTKLTWLLCTITLAASVHSPLIAESLGFNQKTIIAKANGPNFLPSSEANHAGLNTHPPLRSIVAANTSFEVRSYNGYGNNVKHPAWGQAGQPHLRESTLLGIPPRYLDGSIPDYPDFPNPRVISNTLGAQGDDILNTNNVSYMIIFWGQFLAHETTLTDTSANDPFPILIPDNDPKFTPGGTIDIERSLYLAGTGTNEGNPRMQLNDTTSFLDASIVYGSDQGTANSLRTFTGGKMKTSAGNLLPRDGSGNFLAGDPRVNENPALIALQTLFVREHNRLADIIHNRASNWSDEKIYQAARKIVGAEIQSITVREYLPALGVVLPPYTGYKQSTNPTIANEFATAVFRFGHSQSDSDELLLFADGTEVERPLNDLFFTPLIFDSEYMDGVLRGSGHKLAQNIDLKMVDAIRNVVVPFPTELFDLDLFAIDVQRGRDHGLPDYNTVRRIYGLKKVKNFSQITSDKNVQSQLKSLYGSVDNIDLFVGMLAEDHMKGKPVGELIFTMSRDQFKKIRDGDRFWYENDPAFARKGELGKLGFDANWISKRYLSSILYDNTNIDETQLQKNVFIVPKQKK